ncbi:LnmK family bifunctional acyltransferase/decarboxylase [Saccharopolyspora phatthalungensis]|uniref:Putative biosynthetic protein (TIGR04098 family) n=1 Tax=Saccharopolyspora phatthalungensis TaxID=664693 RepID=A0A840QK14_9PSEU|nr:LnmK family bifunctional acyltransferase/decarboxylase [Saccharopolyspora phatthalungensis]MBB5159515.1 putative biosynthetic protein (TIGR04098 family) [Saccharopolyspora phatthalungensis]
MSIALSRQSSPPLLVPNLRRVDSTTVARTELVQPSMCGQTSLLCGRIGDWTWDAVSALCGIQVLNARNQSGAPTYLSFYYYHIRGSSEFHLRTPGFGDLLHVTSSVFSLGSESVLTLHRIARTPVGHDPDPTLTETSVDPEEFYSSRNPDCLYVETFNRWITRSDGGGNTNLLRSSPVDFRHAHLPTLPRKYSPRPTCHMARSQHTFLPDRSDEYRPFGEPLRLKYPVDVSRDLNGVGLLYFATYFAIVDWSLLQFWRALGRTDAAFLNRVVLDQKLCFLGNADLNTVIAVDVQGFTRASDPTEQCADVVLLDADTSRALAVCTLRFADAGGVP